MVWQCAVRRALLSAVALAWAGTAGAQMVDPDLLKPENRLVSTSKQFTVFGGTRQERSNLARRAEELKAGLLRELESRDLWRSPILLILTPGDGVRLRQAPVFVQVFDAGEAGRKIQVDIASRGVADEASVDAAILRALLLEWCLRKQQFVGNRFVEPPSWLSAAMSAALARKDPAETARLYSALLESKGMPRLDKFLGQNAEALRGRARDLHAAQSLALFQSLTEGPGGRGKVVENLTLAEPAEDAVERFGQTWPEFVADPAKLARTWALGVARLSSPQKVEILSSRETSEKLGDVLESLQTKGDSTEPARAVLDMARTPEGRFLAEKAAKDLQRLGFRAHPLYAALVQEYYTMLDNLSRKKRGRFVAKFTEAEELRLALDARSDEITNFLDSYQASAGGQEPVVSISVRQAAAQARSSRNDAISRFIDSVEQRGW